MERMDGRAVVVLKDDRLVATRIAAALRARGATVPGPAPSARRAPVLGGGGGPSDTAVLDVDGARDASIAEAIEAKVALVFATGVARDETPARFTGAWLWEEPVDVEGLARSLAPPRP